MRKVGPWLPLQGISDFPGPSQEGWWWCQGVGTSPTPPWGLHDGGCCKRSWMLTPSPEHGKYLGPACKGSTRTGHSRFLLFACARGLRVVLGVSCTADIQGRSRLEGTTSHSTRQDAGTKTAAGFYFYTSPPCPLCRNDIIMGI